GGCLDTANGSSVGASMRLAVDTHNSTHPLPGVRNTYQIESGGSSFGPNSPVLIVLAFGASTTGLPFPGVSCNNIHLGLGRTWFIHPVLANAVGELPTYSFGVTNGLLPYNNQWHGINLFVQGVWDDSVTASMKFSAGARNSFLAPPKTTSADIRMRTFYDPDPLIRVARGMGDGDSTSIPIIRYKN
ncbi:MAG: hypothetical protein VX951_07030, partial [Planctomycetota bacterium]|nr:hypothetical protein [Planctomycetota bacterium]